LTFLGSTLLGSALPAAGLGFALYVLTAVARAIPSVGRYTPLGLTDPARALALGQPPPHLLGSLVASLTLVVAVLAIAWLVFQRREIER
jgi:hypothetical protein